MTVARFSPDGLQVYVGTSAGDVAIFNLRTKNVGRVWAALVRSNPKLTTPPAYSSRETLRYLRDQAP